MKPLAEKIMPHKRPSSLLKHSPLTDPNKPTIKTIDRGKGIKCNQQNDNISKRSTRNNEDGPSHQSGSGRSSVTTVSAKRDMENKLIMGRRLTIDVSVKRIQSRKLSVDLTRMSTVGNSLKTTKPVGRSSSPTKEKSSVLTASTVNLKALTPILPTPTPTPSSSTVTNNEKNTKNVSKADDSSTSQSSDSEDDGSDTSSSESSTSAPTDEVTSKKRISPTQTFSVTQSTSGGLKMKIAAININPIKIPTKENREPLKTPLTDTIAMKTSSPVKKKPLVSSSNSSCCSNCSESDDSESESIDESKVVKRTPNSKRNKEKASVVLTSSSESESNDSDAKTNIPHSRNSPIKKGSNNDSTVLTSTSGNSNSKHNKLPTKKPLTPPIVKLKNLYNNESLAADNASSSDMELPALVSAAIQRVESFSDGESCSRVEQPSTQYTSSLLHDFVVKTQLLGTGSTTPKHPETIDNRKSNQLVSITNPLPTDTNTKLTGDTTKSLTSSNNNNLKTDVIVGDKESSSLPSPTVKRKRGRPRKQSTFISVEQPSAPDAVPSSESPDSGIISTPHSPLQDNTTVAANKPTDKKLVDEKSIISRSIISSKSNKIQSTMNNNTSKQIGTVSEQGKSARAPKLNIASLEKSIYATERVLYPPRRKKRESIAVTSSSKTKKSDDSLDPIWRKIDIHKKFRRPSVSGYKSDGGSSTICSKVLAAQSDYVNDYVVGSGSGARSFGGYSGYKSDYSCKSRRSGYRSDYSTRAKSCGYRTDCSIGSKHRRKVRRKRRFKTTAKTVNDFDLLQFEGLSLGQSGESSRDSLNKPEMNTMNHSGGKKSNYRKRTYKTLSARKLDGATVSGANVANHKNSCASTSGRDSLTNLCERVTKRLTGLDASKFTSANYDSLVGIYKRPINLSPSTGTVGPSNRNDFRRRAASISSRRSSAVSHCSSRSTISRHPFRRRRRKRLKSRCRTDLNDDVNNAKLNLQIDMLVNTLLSCHIGTKPVEKSATPSTNNRDKTVEQTGSGAVSTTTTTATKRLQKKRKASEYTDALPTPAATTTTKRRHKKTEKTQSPDDHKLPLKKRHYLLTPGEKVDGKLVVTADDIVELEKFSTGKDMSSGEGKSSGHGKTVAGSKSGGKIVNKAITPKKRHLLETPSGNSSDDPLPVGLLRANAQSKQANSPSRQQLLDLSPSLQSQSLSNSVGVINKKNEIAARKKSRLEGLLSKISPSVTITTQSKLSLAESYASTGLKSSIVRNNNVHSAPVSAPPPGVFEPTIDIELQIPAISIPNIITKTEIDSPRTLNESINKLVKDEPHPRPDRVVESLLNKTGGHLLLKKKRKKQNRTGFPTVKKKKKRSTESLNPEQSDILPAITMPPELKPININSTVANETIPGQLKSPALISGPEIVRPITATTPGVVLKNNCDRVPKDGETADTFIERNSRPRLSVVSLERLQGKVQSPSRRDDMSKRPRECSEDSATKSEFKKSRNEPDRLQINLRRNIATPRDASSDNEPLINFIEKRRRAPSRSAAAVPSRSTAMVPSRSASVAPSRSSTTNTTPLVQPKSNRFTEKTLPSVKCVADKSKGWLEKSSTLIMDKNLKSPSKVKGSNENKLREIERTSRLAIVKLESIQHFEKHIEKSKTKAVSSKLTAEKLFNNFPGKLLPSNPRSRLNSVKPSSSNQPNFDKTAKVSVNLPIPINKSSDNTNTLDAKTNKAKKKTIEKDKQPDISDVTKPPSIIKKPTEDDSIPAKKIENQNPLKEKPQLTKISGSIESCTKESSIQFEPIDSVDYLEHDPLPPQEGPYMSDDSSSTSTDTSSKRSIKLKKRYLVAGLFSDFYKEDGSGKSVSTSTNNLEKLLNRTNDVPINLLPPPPYCERYFRQTVQDFQLPYDLWFAHTNSKLPGRDLVPTWKFKKIRTNIYGEAVRSWMTTSDQQSCSCKPQTECRDDCLNRMVYTECVPETCPCGDRCENTRIQKHIIAPGVERFMTVNKGWGVQTNLPIKKGTYILEYVGEVVTEREFKDRMATLYIRDTHHYGLNLDGGLIIDGHRMGSDCRFVNHSCSPNCEMQKWSVNGLSRMVLFAMRDIRAGEELTYDYNFSLYNPTEGQPCCCGSQQCRGVIGGKSQRIKPIETTLYEASPSKGRSGRPRKRQARKNQLFMHSKDGCMRIAFQLPTQKEELIIANGRIFLFRNLRKIRRTKYSNNNNTAVNQSLTPTNLTAQISALRAPRNIRTRGLTIAECDPAIEKTARIAGIWREICEELANSKDKSGQNYIVKLSLPSRKKCPLYYERIPKPIDLSTIEMNVEKGVYGQPTLFDADVLRMLSNVVKYYGIASAEGIAAEGLLGVYNAKKGSVYQRLVDIIGDADINLLANFHPNKPNQLLLNVDPNEDVIQCICGLFKDEGLMIQCAKCLVWQHTECTGADTSVENYLCERCEPRSVELEISLNEYTDEGFRYYLSLLRGDLQIRQSDTVYVLRDIPIKENSEEPTVTVDGQQSIRKHTYETIGDWSFSECDIFRVERLWKNADGKRFVFGHHYLRPHETYHEPTRKFYQNEVVRVPLYEVVPIELIMGRCWVLDPTTFCKGRPVDSSEAHVYICELRVDKAARLFSKISKHQYPVCQKTYAFNKFEQKLKISRNYLPHDVENTTIKNPTKPRKKSDDVTNGSTMVPRKNSVPIVQLMPPPPKTLNEKRSRLETHLLRLLNKLKLVMIEQNTQPLDLSYLLTGRGTRRRANTTIVPT